jgi:hypothetical protein
VEKVGLKVLKLLFTNPKIAFTNGSPSIWKLIFFSNKKKYNKHVQEHLREFKRQSYLLQINLRI